MSNDNLLNQLIKLGDMMGDDMHREPGGKWISREYRKIALALGYIKPESSKELINSHMQKRVIHAKCQKCTGNLKQTRSGSKRAKCEGCGAKYQLLK